MDGLTWCNLAGSMMAGFTVGRLRTYWRVFSPGGWRPQQSQASTKGLESSWGATGLEEAGKAEEVGF